MKTLKAYTDLEQSKKLVKILPLESADMHYQYVLPKSDKIKHNPEIGNPVNALEWYNRGYTTFGKEPITLDEYCIPCWSLAALLDILPKDESIDCTITFGYYNSKVEYIEKWLCAFEKEGETTDDFIIETIDGSNPIDACVDMIMKLHELKLL
jgi:hypothetical protein